MRAYLIDEISPPDMKRINDFFKETALSSNLEGVYWVKLPHDFLNSTQFEHRQCQPHVFAVELGSDFFKLELFIRSLNGMQCTCPGFCNDKQMHYIFNFVHGMIEQLGIKT
jgi:hypothetical protein